MASSFDRFLAQSKKFSVQLIFRENGEIPSGVYIIHNDAYSVCFIQYWLSFFSPPPADTGVPITAASIVDNPNSDNGALGNTIKINFRLIFNN